MTQTYLPRLIWVMATLAALVPTSAALVPTSLEAQVVPVYTDPVDVCITCAVSGIYQAEPSVFVSPVDSKRILVTANTWNSPDYGLDFPMVWPRVTPCVTADGGATWQCQTSGIPSGTTRPVADPASVITGAGRNYCSPFYGAEDGSVDQGCAVSTNNGVPGSWSNAAFPYDATQQEPGVDKGHIWVDGAERLYAAWTHCDDFHIKLRYADDGATLQWLPEAAPITLSDVAGRQGTAEDRGVNIQAGPGGKVYATWIKRKFAGDPGNALGFARSINQGQSWPTKTYISQVIDGGITKTLTVRELLLGLGSGLGSGKTMPVQSYPSMTVNSDTVYVVWANRGNPVGAVGDPEIYLIRSPDSGNTWYGPFRVNQDVGTADQWFPWVTWDSATRSLVVAFYDSRNVSNGAELYIAASRNYGTTWTETRISDGASGGAPSFTADASGAANDYLGVHARDGLAYAVWADDRDRTVGQSEPPAVNGRPWKLYSSPLFVGGILQSTVSDYGQRYCITGIPKFKLTVSWQTLVVGDKVRLEVYPPGATCEGTPTYVKEVTSTTTSPSVFLEMHCVVGTWKYVIKSIKGQGLSKLACTEFYVSSCPTCDEVD